MYLKIIFKTIVSYFVIKTDDIPGPSSSDILIDNISRLSDKNSLERITYLYDILYRHQTNRSSSAERFTLRHYEADSVIDVMNTLEDVGMLNVISIDELLNYYYMGGQQIVSVLIEVDYWGYIDRINDPGVLIKILKISSDEDLNNRILLRLKLEIDNIDKMNLLEEYIKEYKELTEIYIYGVNKLFDMYRQYIRGIEADYVYDFIENRIKANIDLSVVPSYKLYIHQIEEKLESQKILTRVGSINRLDDIAILMSGTNPPFIQAIYQEIINGIIRGKLIEDELTDDELIEMYYLASDLKTKKDITFLIKQKHGFVYQQTMFLSEINLDNQFLLESDEIYYSHDLDSLSLDELTVDAKDKLAESIREYSFDFVDLLDYCNAILESCNSSYSVADVICKDFEITESIRRLSKTVDLKNVLVESLYIVGGHFSIIERFFQLNPNASEINLLGNTITKLNDNMAESCYATELENYINTVDIDIAELKAIYDIFKGSYKYKPITRLIAKKITAHNPQLH